MSPIRFAIVGFGNIGQRHAQHIVQHQAAQLVAVCDIDSQKASLVQVPFYTNLDEMLEQIDAEVLCVCTPNYLHEKHCIAALEHSWHALVEKPMALSTAECNRMIATAQKHNKLIFAVKQNRYNPPVVAVKNLIEQQLLGKIFMIQVNCFWNRGDSYYQQSAWRGKKVMDGGCLFTQFSHFIDILYYLNGPIVNSYGQVANYAHQHNTEFEDTGSFVAKAQNGALINFNFTTCAYQKNREGSISIFAEKGCVKIGGQYLNTVEYQNIADYSIPEIQAQAQNNDYGHYQGSMSNHDKVIENVVQVLQHKAQIMTTAEEGRDVVQMIEQLYASVR